MAVTEEVRNQISRLDKFKDERYTKNKVMNSLRSFAYYIDLD